MAYRDRPRETLPWPEAEPTRARVAGALLRADLLCAALASSAATAAVLVALHGC